MPIRTRLTCPSWARPGACLPEQAGGLEVDERSDIFNLGAVLFEMLTGRPAFEGTTAGNVSRGVRDAAPTLPDTIPKAVAEIVTTALRRTPVRVTRPPRSFSRH